MRESWVAHGCQLGASHRFTFRLTRRELPVEIGHRVPSGDIVNAPQGRYHRGCSGFGEGPREATVDRARIVAADIRLAGGKRNQVRTRERQFVIVLDKIFD